ncbi:MAG: hypothetical protein WAM28_05770 [Chlamydiales bacterium]
MACEVQWNVIVPPATHIEIEGIKYPLEPKDPAVSNNNSFYAAIGKIQNVAHDKLRQNICQSMLANKNLYDNEWICTCAILRAELNDIKRFPKKAEEFTEEGVKQVWIEYTQNGMRDNVIPEMLEVLETAAYINRVITIVLLNGQSQIVLATCFTPDREVIRRDPNREGDLILVDDNGYYRLLADKV